MYKYGIIEFEWDNSKDRINELKHQVTFIEAVETFFDPNGFQLIDDTHSKFEERYYWVGISKTGRVLTTYFTKRGHKVRIIGCAEWRKFRRLYYEVAKNESS